jgi:hypothetical protein
MTMLRKITPCLFALLAGSLLLTAQDPVAPKAPDPEVAAKIAVLDECVVDRKLAHDAEGRETIDFLLTKLQAGLCDKDQKAVAKAFENVLWKGKVREPDKTEIYVAAVVALGYCGADGAKALTKAYENKRFPDKKEWVPLREHMLKGIGRTKQEVVVKFLLDEARTSPEDALMAAAGEALGNFEASDEKVRKPIVSDLLKKWGALDEKESQLGAGNVEAINARNTLAAITNKWNETLAKLTGQNFTKFFDWQRWNNDNKGKPWK